MIGTLVDIVSAVALVVGAAFYLIGAVGMIRMPDVFTRMHATSVSDTLGAGLMVLGMILQAGPSLLAIKLVFLILVMWTTGAVASHALARAALHDGEKPLLAQADGELRPTDPVELFPELGVRIAQPLSSETLEEAGPPTVDDSALADAAEGGYGTEADRANRDATPPAETR